MGLSASFNIYRQKLLFAGITLTFILSQTAFFQGFNGVDDLHYAFLAHRMLQGQFSPFVLNDLFGGRALLVAIQAMVYAIGGVGLFTTQAASYAAVVVACYLTIFKLLQAASPWLVFIAAALFYFNPILADITLGPAPDVFILMAGVLLLLLKKRLNSNTSQKNCIITGLVAGLFIFSTLFLKESGLVFLPFAAINGLFLKERKTWFISALLVSFSMAVVVCGWVYYLHTGNFFFRVKQLQVAAYPNPCGYSSFFQKEMLIRLTYGVWQEFLLQNFLPVLLAVIAIAQEWFSRKEGTTQLAYKREFLILLLVGLYFPFSVSNYQPLCFKSRHFLFLLPLAVVISSQWLQAGYAQQKTGWYRNAIAAILIGSSIKFSNNGWNWDFYRCLLAFLLLFPFLTNKKLAAATPVLLAAILWLSLPYRFIYHRASWFKDLASLNNQLSGNHFYFADHDNLMHWKLFKQFDTTNHYFNFNEKPFLIDNPYYEPLYFHAGWFIVNRQYTTLSPQFVACINSLQQSHFFKKTIITGQVSAGYISDERQFSLLKTLMQQEKSKNCNCEASNP